MASYKAGVEEGLRAAVSYSPERESHFTEETREDRGEELLRNEKDSSLENLGYKGMPDQKEDVFFPAESFEREMEEGEGSCSSPEGQWRKEAFAKETRDDVQGRPAENLAVSIEADVQNVESMSSYKAGVEEGLRAAVSHSPERESHFTEETREDMGEELLRNEKDSSLENLGYKGMPDQKEDVFFPAESFEREIEEGEASPEGHGQWRKEAFAKETRETRDDVQGRPAENLAVSIEAESPAEQEEGYPSEATSSAVPPPHVSHGGIEFQDRIQEEQKIMADINAIKKIVGYQGEPHASIMEQISALYMFLGMEPYYWAAEVAAEVDNFEKAQAEIELLKVVVGVK